MFSLDRFQLEYENKASPALNTKFNVQCSFTRLKTETHGVMVMVLIAKHLFVNKAVSIDVFEFFLMKLEIYHN